MTLGKKESPAERGRAAANDPTREAAARRLEGLDTASPARDVAGLLAQSPRVLFFFWRFARDPRETLRRALGASGEGLQLAVRLVDLEGDAVVTYAAAPGSQSIWFGARPRRAYRAEVGFFAAGAPFVRVLSSNVVETAPDAPSQLSDEAADFRTTARDFAGLLTASGFAGLAREFAPGATALVASDDGPPNSSTLTRRAPSSFALAAPPPREEAEPASASAPRPGAAENF
jgi:hypothetical protein